MGKPRRFRPDHRKIIGAAILLFAGAALADRLEDTFYLPLDHPAIQYAQEPVTDPVAGLEKRLEAGKAKLTFAAGGSGYLASVLRELGIGVDSQILVFSKGSIQTKQISPLTPRAIYFNDDTAVGFVQNGDVLELSALDPRKGVIFYSLDAKRSDQPEFARRDECLRCHQGPITLGVPGIFVSSLHPRTVEREVHGNSFVTDHRTPLNERWGGCFPAHWDPKLRIPRGQVVAAASIVSPKY